MADASASAHVESLHHKARHLGVISRKPSFSRSSSCSSPCFSVFVPTFLTVPNLLALLQSVAILGTSLDLEWRSSLSAAASTYR